MENPKAEVTPAVAPAPVSPKPEEKAAKPAEDLISLGPEFSAAKHFKKDGIQDFQVRVHIIEARELQPRDKNGSCDPVCVVNVLNQKKHTITHKKTAYCTWDHLLFFELKETAQTFFNGKVNITVFDANTLFRNVEIGSFEFDIKQIFERKDHEYFRQWVALSDSTGKFTGQQGYLKMSVTVLGPGDQAPSHKAEEEEDEENDGTDLQAMVLLPPTMKTTMKQLNMYFWRGENLPKMDTFGKCDGFVSVKFGGTKEVKTEKDAGKFDPIWNEKIEIPVPTPTMSDVIKVQVKDWDAGLTADEIISTFYLNFSATEKKDIDWFTPRWVNLYGAPTEENIPPAGQKAKLAEQMNNGGVDGCLYKGRVLMSMDSNVNPSAKPGKSKISGYKEPATLPYTFRAEVYEICELQDEKSEYSVTLSVGPYSKSSQKVKSTGGDAHFYSSIDDIIANYPLDKSQIPDIFLNVMRHNLLGQTTRVGYVRLKASDLSATTAPKWHLLEPNPFADIDENKVVGFINFKVCLAPKDQFSAPEPIKTPLKKKFNLRAHIYQARDLKAGDDNGLSDPYCVVRLGKYSVKTKEIEKTCFPLWYESLSMNVELSTPLEIYSPELSVMIFDKDTLKDDFLGRTSLSVATLSTEMPSVPKWYPLYMKKTNDPEGEVLMSFQLIPIEDAGKYPAPKSLLPKMKDVAVEFSVVGLRDILPYQLLPVDKTWVELDVGGKDKVSTKQKPGKNPNFLETLVLKCSVPEDPLYAPPINIKVYDERLLGAFKPLVASRSFSMLPFLPWKDKVEMTEEAKKQLASAQEDTLLKVEQIPGSAYIKEEEKVEPKEGKQEVPLEVISKESAKSSSEIKIDMEPHDDRKSLLEEKDNKRKTTGKGLVLSPEAAAEAVSAKLSKAQETVQQFIPGAEDEPEEPKGPERSQVKNELEFELKDSTITQYKLYRAKQKGLHKIKIEVGEVKCRVRILEKGTKDDNTLDLQALYKPRKTVVRLYVLSGFQLVPKDSNGENNPYLWVRTAKFKQKDVEKRQQRTSRPDFFQRYEIPVEFPDEAVIDLSIWDYDAIGFDDLIGTTRIDLEQRFFSKQWQEYGMKPQEYRTLWNPSSSNPQGQVLLWIDILSPEEAATKPMTDISPPQPIDYELRCIIWNSKDVVFKDGKDSDIVIVGYPEGQKAQSTDTHWNSEDHTGAFNWRMIFPISLPSGLPKFKIQVWDRNIVTANEAICEANLNFRSWYRRVYRQKKERDMLNKQWVTLKHPAFQGPQGSVEVSFELLTANEARKNPAGLGRNPPDALAQPVRPETSFNPFRVDKWISVMFWGKYKFRIIGVCVCIIVVILAIVIGVVVTYLKGIF